ncbi:MAG TPA: hypothetical protein VJY35_06145 [Candidatus Eisenbacteria bacterium]|nr:hypothetical protein [Candidatus Eisenbacteria bacterium]
MTRIRILSHIALLATLLLVIPAASHAFGLTGWGGKVGIIDPEGGSTGPVFSAHLEYDQPGSAWHLLPSVTFWDSNRLSGLGANFDMYYHFVSEGSASPYLGGGVGVNHYSFDGANDGTTRLGANLFGGLRFPMNTGHLFLEGRYTASRISQVGVLGGITFHATR